MSTTWRRRRRLSCWQVCLWVALALRLAGAETSELRIATYNVENYGPADRMTEVGFREDYPKPERQKEALRAVIRAMNVDVLALQEMGKLPYLLELQRDLRAEGVDYPHTALAEAADADRHVAVLSKLPLTDVRTHANVEFAYFGAREQVKRGVLEATVAVGGTTFTVFVVHLKSRYTDRADDPQSATRRAAEATAVRDVILKRFPNPAAARFLLVGDCNDTKPSKTLAHLQRRGQTPVAVLLSAADSRGETWTHCWRREDTYSRVDHVLVSPALLTALVGKSATIYDGPGVRDASDHRPVMVTLRVGSGGGGGEMLKSGNAETLK